MEKIQNKPRELYLTGTITFDNINTIKQKIIEITDKDNELEETFKDFEREPIILYIDTYGGSVYNGLGLIDLIEDNKTPIYTVCLGCAMSMGFWIFIMGKKRFIGDRATLMFHDLSVGLWDKTEGLKQELKEMQRLQALLMEDTFIQSRGSVTDKMMNDYIERKAEWYIPAREAIELNLADEPYYKLLEKEDDNENI